MSPVNHQLNKTDPGSRAPAASQRDCKKCPSTRRTLFFNPFFPALIALTKIFIVSFVLLLDAGVLLAADYIEENDRVMKGVISAVREDYISLAQSSEEKAAEVETAFFRRGEIDLINVDHWHQLQEGQTAVVLYKEKISVREDKNDKGGTVRETKLMSRDIRSIEVPPPPLPIDQQETSKRAPGMLKSGVES